VVEIPILASHPDLRTNPVKVRIELVKDLFKQKKLLAEITLRESSWKIFKYNLRKELGQKIILLFQVSRTWNPKKSLGADDSRDLGIALGKIRLRRGLIKQPRPQKNPKKKSILMDKNDF